MLCVVCADSCRLTATRECELLERLGRIHVESMFCHFTMRFVLWVYARAEPVRVYSACSILYGEPSRIGELLSPEK